MKQIARRSLGIFLSLMMLLTAIPSAFALESDIKGHWAEEALQSFVDDGYLAGDGKGHYTPNATMTRAQFATILNRLTGLTEESAAISNYTDVSESDWYYHELAKALAAGFMSGTSATTMSPNAPITRQQAFTMLARYLNLDTSDTSALASFADQTAVADYAKGPVAAMVTAGYVQGSGDGKILPEKQLTRAEGVTVLYRAKTALQAVTPSVTVGYKDGVYIGTGAGYGGTVKVQMTVSGGKITNLEVLSHSDTSGYFNRAKKLLDTVLDKQGTDGVDTVSGATKSSNGLLTAINACISQAQGGADTSKTGSTGSGGGGAGASTKPEGEDFSGALKDGTYTGSARGYSGTTQVTVTVSGGKITAITVDSHGDTSSYFNSAKGVISKMIEKQSTDVDAVSGATYSSWGIINAVADALKDAVPTGEKTYQVSNWSEFITALAKASDGDTIQLTGNITDAGERYQTLTKEDGSTYETLVDAVSSATLGMATINKAITIDGDGHSISAGADMAYCFNISGSGVVMQDLTIDGASYGARMGGGLYLAGGHGSTVAPSLELMNVTIKNCRSYKSSMPGNGGGAIYCKGAVTLTATDCAFEENVVNTGLGGAILAQNANVTLKDCTFTGNTAPYGGAIAATGTANLTVTGCQFTETGKDDNNATYGGDDIYIFDGKTPGKSGSFSDSAVSYALSGNTYSADDTGEDAWKGYAVVLGRYVADETESGGKNYTGSGMPFITENGHDLTFTGWERTELESENSTDYKYVLMNIPYADFYAAELNNEEEVDAVTSATKAKTRTGSLVGGSYHEKSDGSDISGITFPVVMSATDFESFKSGKTEITDSDSVSITVTNRGQTSTNTYTGKEALFESADYSYYVLSEAPANYKVATYDSVSGKITFSKIQGVTTALSGVKASLQTESSYGDYQINLMDDSGTISADGTVYGVILSTQEGNDYGLRHLENIWRGTELAFCTGFTTSVHNSPTSSAHYEAIMGQTITQITYLTNTGIYTIDCELYVPVKFNGVLSVANAAASAGTTAVSSSGFPVGYAAKISVANGSGEDVTNTYGFALTGSTLTWTGAPAVGAYTLTVNDASGVYAPYSAGFELQTAAMPAMYDGTTFSLVKAEDATDEELADYLSSITSVKVGDVSYAASGRGAVTVINGNGSVDLTASPFSGMAAGSEYAVEVTATGYSTALTFKITIPETLYGTAALTYKQFYSGDVTSVEAFDAVTSATTSKYATFKNTDYELKYEDEVLVGYTTSGVKNVNVAIDPENLSNTSGITFTGFTTATPAQYKTVNADGSLSATTFSMKATVTDATPTLVTGGVWGDYQINVVENPEAENKYLRNNRTDDGWAVNSAIQGVILETADGLKVGTAHMENIWVQPWEVAWDTEGQANSTELSKLIGKNVTKITYIMPDGAYVYDFDDGLYIKPQYTGAAITGAFGDGMATVTLSALPEGMTNPKLTVGYKVGRNTVYLLQDAAISENKTFELTPSVVDTLDEGGAYSVTIISENYANYSVAIPMTSEQENALEALIAQADALLEANSSNTTLQEHRNEAAELLENTAATSAEAASLIAELTELINLATA